MRDFWESVVEIETPDGFQGSGVFIAEDAILTAGHVVAPAGVVFEPSAIAVIVRYLVQEASVLDVVVHPRWIAGARAGADMALLKVEPIHELGLGILLDTPAPAQSLALAGIGFLADTGDVKQPRGEVSCEASRNGFHLLRSDDLKPESGLSGGPLYTMVGEQAQVVGIMTRTGASRFVGLPLLNATFGRLQRSLAARGSRR